MMGLKALKRLVITMTVLIFIGSTLVSACTSYKETLRVEDIIGYYEFSENIFTNPLSSFFPNKDDMPYYEISNNSLKIINNRDGSVQEFAGDFEKSTLSEDDFKTLFMKGFPTPDITQYKECYQYATYSFTENVQKILLYVMDREVWIADFHGKYIWSIYGLTKTDTIKPDGKGGFVIPDFQIKTTAGFQLEICRSKEVIDSVFIKDNKAMDILHGIILDYNLKSSVGENVDINTVGEYFRFYDTREMNGLIYFAFFNEALDPEPQIQSVKTPFGRTFLSKDQYESLYELLKSGFSVSTPYSIPKIHFEYLS